MKRSYFLILASMMLVSCNENESGKAYALLDEAREAVVENDFDSARRLIDSLRTSYPREFDARRAALAFSDTIELEQAKCDLKVADSIFTFKEFELADMKKQFVLEKQPKYQTKGYYVTPDYAGDKSSYSFFPEVEETGALLLVSVNRSVKIDYSFTEVEIDLSSDVIPPAQVSRSLTNKEQSAYEKCYRFARSMKEHKEAKEAKEKYDMKVRFFERKINEQNSLGE